MSFWRLLSGSRLLHKKYNTASKIKLKLITEFKLKNWNTARYSKKDSFSYTLTEGKYIFFDIQQMSPVHIFNSNYFTVTSGNYNESKNYTYTTCTTLTADSMSFWFFSRRYCRTKTTSKTKQYYYIGYKHKNVEIYPTEMILTVSNKMSKFHKHFTLNSALQLILQVLSREMILLALLNKTFW